MPSDIGCTAKYLPSELSVVAAETAVRQNPVNRVTSENLSQTGMIFPKDYLAVMTSKYWGANGVKLTVGFMENTPADLRNRIIMHMNAWREYANVSFAYSEVSPQVRITREGQGYWSYLGTDILHIPKNEPTLCLQAFTMQTPEPEYRRVVRHETGHTLGFPHEHMRKSIVDRIDVNKAIAYFRQTQGWNATMVQEQVLKPLAAESIFGTPDADETSIMAYTLPGVITKDGKPIIGGSDIAPQDIEFVSKIYPKAGTPPQPPEAASGKGMDMNVDFEKKLVSIRLPAGWTVTKKAATNGVVMSELDLPALALELESSLPATGDELDSAKQSAIGGIVSKIMELVNALKSQDFKKIATAVRDLLNILLGDQQTSPSVTGGDGDVTISFSTQAAAMKLDWSKLIAVLLKLLPVLLG